MVGVLLTELPRHPELREIIQTPLTIIEKISRLIARYQREGLLVEEPPMQAFAAFVGPILLREVVKTIEPDQVKEPFDPVVHVRGICGDGLPPSFLAIGKAEPQSVRTGDVCYHEIERFAVQMKLALVGQV